MVSLPCYYQSLSPTAKITEAVMNHININFLLDYLSSIVSSVSATTMK